VSLLLPGENPEAVDPSFGLGSNGFVVRVERQGKGSLQIPGRSGRVKYMFLVFVVEGRGSTTYPPSYIIARGSSSREDRNSQLATAPVVRSSRRRPEEDPRLQQGACSL